MRMFSFTRGNSLLIVMVVVTLLPIMVITFLTYKNNRETTIQEYIGSLHAINESRVAHINNLIHLRMEQVVLLTSYIDELGENALSDPEKIERLQQHIDSSYSALQKRARLKNRSAISDTAVASIVIRNSVTDVVATTDPNIWDDPPLKKNSVEIFKKNNFKNIGYSNEYVKSKGRGYRNLSFSVGLRHLVSGEFIGVIVLNVRPEILNRITTNRVGLRESGESYLVNRDNVMISDSRFLKGSEGPILVDTEGVRAARKGNKKVLSSYDDYRGVRVFGANHYFEESGWILLTEMDESEILAAVNHTFRENLTITGIVAVLAFVLAASLAKIFNRIGLALVKKEEDALLIKRVAVLANAATNADATICRVLGVVCEYTGWPIGHVYFISPDDPDLLISTTLWFVDDEDRYKEFKIIAEETNFERGIGLPGKVLEMGRPHWIPDVTKSENFPRAEQGVDIKVKGAFAFPVIAENSVVAVFEFFSNKVEEPNASVLDIMTQIGIEVGNVIKRREHEQALIESKIELEKGNRLKQDFLTMISHELRTPLHAVYGGIQVAEDQMQDKLRTPFYVIKNGTEDIMAMVNDILIYTEIQASELSVCLNSVQLGAALEELHGKYVSRCNEKNLTLKWFVDETMPSSLLADADKFIHIFTKLLDNAVKYTEQGFVEFSLRYDNASESPLLNCLIADSGIGMEMTDKHYVFEPFKQHEGGMRRQYGGLGVGLTICKELVTLIGGSMDMVSSVYEGTQFTLSLPVSLGVAATTGAAQAKSSAEQPILVVEDNKTNQLIMKQILTKLGYNSVVANHGGEALEILNAQSISLVLMDLQMPIMDGFTCTQRIRSSTDKIKNIPIIAVTANLMDADKQRCMEYGMNNYLAKPVRMDHLKKSLLLYIE